MPPNQLVLTMKAEPMKAASTMRLPLLDEVRVTAIRAHRFDGEPVFEQRHPRVGDVGVILAVHADAYEVECSDADGITIWLEAMHDDEIGAC